MNINNHRFTGALQLLEFQATSKCNLQCFFCADSISNSEDLSLELVQKVLNEIKPIGVSFTGGEPLLNKNLLNIIKWCSHEGYITQINTNGLLLNDTNVPQYEEAGLNLWHISRHYSSAVRAKHYQGITKENYDHVGIMVEWLAQRKLDVNVETTLNITNLYDLTKIHNWLYNIGVDVHEIVPVMMSGKSKSNRFTVPLYILYRTLDDFLANKKDIFVKVGCMPLPPCKYKDLWDKYNGHKKINFADCKEGKSRLHIHNNGDIIICDQTSPLSETPIGNAKTDSIWDIYENNPIIKAWRARPDFCCDKYGDICQNICQGSEFSVEELKHTKFGCEAFI